MKLCFVGTSAHAVTVLRALAASELRPALVVTPVDRPQGRGRRMQAPPVATAARELGLELHQSENVNRDQTLSLMGAAGIDVGMVCAFGQLIGSEILSSFELLNVHPSLLPRWRGAAPIERSIMAGDERTGTSIMRIGEGLDSGPVAMQESVEIAPGENFGSLDGRLADLGGALALTALRSYAEGTVSWTEQDESAVTYAEKIERSDRLLDPARPAIELERTVRALTPHVGAQLELAGGERLGVREVTAQAREAMRQGAIAVSEDGSAIELACGQGILQITSVLPAGGREMAASDYLRGRGVPTLEQMPR